jgi:hypothetical protein
MILALFLAAMMGQAQPIAPPLALNTADCVRPTFATDQLICDDPSLRELDRDLAAMLNALPSSRLAAPWIEAQPEWFRRSRLCAFRADHKACVTAAYHDRARVLMALAAPTALIGRCKLADGSPAQLSESDGVGVLMTTGHILAVGTTDGADWTPFMRYVRKGDRTMFRSLEGKKIASCRSGVSGKGQ